MELQGSGKERGGGKRHTGWPAARSPPTLGWWVDAFGAEPAGRIWILNSLGSSEESRGWCCLMSQLNASCGGEREERGEKRRRELTAEPPSVDILLDFIESDLDLEAFRFDCDCEM